MSAPDKSPPAPASTVDQIRWVSDLIRLEIILWERIDASLRERPHLPLSFFESLRFISQAPGGSMRVGDLARRCGSPSGERASSSTGSKPPG